MHQSHENSGGIFLSTGAFRGLHSYILSTPIIAMKYVISVLIVYVVMLLATASFAQEKLSDKKLKRQRPAIALIFC